VRGWRFSLRRNVYYRWNKPQRLKIARGVSLSRIACIAQIRCDTIRDAILTCAQKPIRVSWIYRTEPTTKLRKTEKKLKSKKMDMLRSISKQSGESTMRTGDTYLRYTKTTEPAGCRLGASICRLAQTIIRWGGAHWCLQAANTLCAAAAVSPDATVTVSTCTCISSRQEAPEEDRIHSITQ